MMKKKFRQILFLIVPMIGGFFLISFLLKEQVGSSQGLENSNSEYYFSGKTIEWLVPFKEGGGGDTWARFNAPFFTKHLPGHPIVIITNVPGGGSIKGSNQFANKVEPDGLMILGTSGSTQMPFLLDDPRVKYDYADYIPIMAYPTGGVVYVSSSLGIKDAGEIAQIKDVPLIFASQGPTSLDLVPTLSFHLLGMNVKTVFGFRGRGAGRLAFERGEVRLDYQTSSAYLKNVVPMVESGEAIPLWSWGIIDEDGGLIRDPSFPKLPHFGEVYEIMKGKKGEGIAFDSWFSTMAAGFGGMKLLLVPKETPKYIVKIYQEAITRIKNDPEYIERKVKAIGLYEQEVGKRAYTIFDLATNIAMEEKEWCKEFLRKYYDLNI